jgi:hypothetical protein
VDWIGQASVNRCNTKIMIEKERMKHGKDSPKGT